MIVRRLRSIRRSSMPQHGGVEAAQRRAPGGVVGSMRGASSEGSFGVVRSVVGGLAVVVGVAGQAEEGVLEAAGGDLEVAGVGLR